MDNEFGLTRKKAEEKQINYCKESREAAIIDGSKRKINFKNGEVDRC